MVAIVLRRTALAICLIGLLFLLMPQFGTVAYPEEGQIGIVFDMSHDQPLSIANSNFTKAIDYFKNYSEYYVKILDNEIMAENLSRMHILVIPNPGRNFSIAELETISNFVTAGGNLFLLGDYQTDERRIGNPEALNQILNAIPESKIHFSTFEQNNETQGDAIVDSINNLTIPYNVKVSWTQIADKSREIIGADINQIVLAGGSLITDNPGFLVSKGANTSQAITPSGAIIQNQPGWLAAFWIDHARVVLCTSTTMFSNTKCAGLNSSWFECADNSKLWSNIFRWLSGSLIHNPTPIMIVFVAIVLLVGTSLLIYSLWRKIREH